jgi:hypothetical protein
MELRKQQDQLVRLLTDTEMLRSWTGGSEPDIPHFADPSEVADFAESLFHKRLHEVAKHLPLTRDTLGSEFAEGFREFSLTFNPTTTKRHVEDALAFCRFILDRMSKSDDRRATVRFELSKLGFFGHRKRFAFCFLSPSIAAGRRLSFAIWIRFGGRVRFFIR